MTSPVRASVPATLPLAAGVVVGVAFILTVAAASGVALLSHTDCAKGNSLGTVLYWTPFDLVNAPYLGSTSYSASFELYELYGLTKVTGHGIIGNGNISAGYFETENWTLYAQGNQTVLGPGVSSACEMGFNAEISPTNYTVSFDGTPLQGPGNTSNANEPTAFPLAKPTQPAAEFENGFVEANQPAISTCGTPARELNFTSSSFEILLRLPGSGDSPTIVAMVNSLESFTYQFPSDGGVWSVDNLQQNSSPQGPGLAFSWQPC